MRCAASWDASNWQGTLRITRGKRFIATFVPQYGLPNEVTGVLVRITDLARTAVLLQGIAPGQEDGSATYVASLTAELTGWDDSGARIREALAHDEFDLYVQDIVALREGTVPARMQEVLIRLRDEEETLIPPGAFLPVAERCGLMAEIDRYVVTRVLAAQKSADAREPGVVCINLSIASFQDASFAEFVAKALERAGAVAESLCFEFEEGDVLARSPTRRGRARALQKIGCRRSMDGFGATRVAFEHLKEVPIDYLKIDGRVIFEILRDSVAMAKVKAIQRVCRTIGVRTIAEQVESEIALLAIAAARSGLCAGFRHRCAKVIRCARGPSEPCSDERRKVTRLQRIAHEAMLQRGLLPDFSSESHRRRPRGMTPAAAGAGRADSRFARPAVGVDRQRRFRRSRSALGRGAAGGRGGDRPGRHRRRRRAGKQRFGDRRSCVDQHDVRLYGRRSLSDAAGETLDEPDVAGGGR
jgi:EAL domain-containing protein (putative c-di-GMP-specific phosphodiesterase class I)